MEMVLPEEKIGWIAVVYDNLHPNESLRVSFQGMLSRKNHEINMVCIELCEDMKLRPSSQIRRDEIRKRKFIGSIYTLPKWKSMYKGEEYIIVDFIAEVTAFEGSVLTVRLPESYTSQSKPSSKSACNPTTSFVAVDFETIQSTTLNGKKYKHLPISIGLVKVINGKIVQKYYSLIKPPVAGYWKDHKSGLTSDDCANAPSYKDISVFIECLIHFEQLVAFDHGTEKATFAEMEKFYDINHSFLHENEFMPYKESYFIDPLERLELKGGKNNTLSEVCERYGIRLESVHNALANAEATALLMLALNENKTNLK